jgi:glycosyltransferase involved in cell wall biosynthesis
MPVFNGKNYIEQAIISILEQTCSDFELIISDNASDDGTEDICRYYTGIDERVRYFRNDINIGAAKNFNRTVLLAKGEFFKWAAHDDMLAPDYLNSCLRVLEKDESLILCFPKTILVDDCGHTIGRYEVSMKNISSESPAVRFRDLVLINHWGIEIFGLFRKRVLDAGELLAGYPGSDRTFIAELSLIGRFYEIPEYLFFSRDHRERSTRIGTIHSRAGWWDTKNSGQTVFPQWRLFLELAKCVNRVPLSGRERRACYLCLLRWLTSNLNWALMLMDLAVAVEPQSWERVRGLKRKISRKGKKENLDTKDDLITQNSKS